MYISILEEDVLMMKLENITQKINLRAAILCSGRERKQTAHYGNNMM